jgi:ureidoacrylate peracid hydrolase
MIERDSLKQAALVIIDMQNAFWNSKGSFARRGYRLIDKNAVLTSIKEICKFFIDRNLVVILSKHIYRENDIDSKPIMEFKPEISDFLKDSDLQWEEEIIAELKFMADTNIYVVEKKAYDVFFKTDLERLLTKYGISELVFGGVLTNVCVETSVRSAFVRGYTPILLSDCTTTYSSLLKRSTILNVEEHFGFITNTDALIKRLTDG